MSVNSHLPKPLLCFTIIAPYCLLSKLVFSPNNYTGLTMEFIKQAVLCDTFSTVSTAKLFLINIL